MFKPLGLVLFTLLAFCGAADVESKVSVDATETSEEAQIDVKDIADSYINSHQSVNSISIENSDEVEKEALPDAAELPSVKINNPSAKEITWTTLADVEYKDVYLEELDAWFWQPIFGETVKEYEGQEVYITGYMVPVDVDTDYFVLSRYPFASCFFCGNAGPESVVDLRLKKEGRKFTQDERLTFSGKLLLNESDVYELNYILEEAVENK